MDNGRIKKASHSLVVRFADAVFEVVPVEPLSFSHLYEFGKELTHPFGSVLARSLICVVILLEGAPQRGGETY